MNLDTLLDGTEGLVAPSISALIQVDGVDRYVRHPDRVYDLASLTKPLATAEVTLDLIARGLLELDRGHPLLPPGVTVRHLLQHASGWPAWRPFHAAAPSRSGVVARVLAEPLEHPPGAVHTYSDLGFIALGAVIEAVTGVRLDGLSRGPLRWGDPTAEPTDGRRGGPVHDLNAQSASRHIAAGAIWAATPRDAANGLEPSRPRPHGTGATRVHPIAQAVQRAAGARRQR